MRMLQRFEDWYFDNPKAPAFLAFVMVVILWVLFLAVCGVYLARWWFG